MKRYRFYDFELDVQHFALYKDGQKLALEPQVLSTLIYLIQNKHKVVSKDELADAIWQNKVVTESALSHTIYQLRKVLSDDAKSPVSIRTAHGRGYQFIASVSEVTPKTNNNQIEKPKLNKTISILLVACLAVLLMLTLFFRPAEEPAVVTGSNLAVMPFYVNSDEPRIAILSVAVADFLVNKLGESQIKAYQPSGFSNKLPDIWEVRYRTRADFILTGSVSAESDMEVNMELILHRFSSTDDMQKYALGSFDLPYPVDNQALKAFFEKRHKIVEELLVILQPGLATVQSNENETLNAEAYRMVIAAYHLQRSDICENYHRAEKLLNMAIELDPEFAYAWRNLFSNYQKRVYICGDSADYYGKAQKAAQKAEALAPGKYDGIIIGLHSMLTETNRVEEGYSSIPHNMTNNPDALYREAYSLRYSGFMAEAKNRIEKVLELDPYYFSGQPVAHNPATLLYLGLYDEYLTLLVKNDNPYHGFYRALALTLSERQQQAQLVLEPIVALVDKDLFGYLARALFAINNNEHALAVSLMDELGASRMEKGHIDGEITYKQAQLFAMAGAGDKALEYLQLAVEQGFFNVSYFVQDPALQLINQDPLFYATLKQASERHIAFSKQFSLPAELPDHVF